jgi:hypothetical protein
MGVYLLGKARQQPAVSAKKKTLQMGQKKQLQLPKCQSKRKYR